MTYSGPVPNRSHDFEGDIIMGVLSHVMNNVRDETIPKSLLHGKILKTPNPSGYYLTSKTS